MTRYTLKPNPKFKEPADPIYLIETDARKIIGSVYHAFGRWTAHKRGTPIITDQPSLRHLRTLMRTYFAQESNQ